MVESELGELAGWRGADLLAELPACAAEDAEEQQVPEEVVARLMNAHEMHAKCVPMHICALVRDGDPECPPSRWTPAHDNQCTRPDTCATRHTGCNAAIDARE